ncbi:MAG: sulfotransferase [Sinimarinibacterium flocculans]|uniref:sulfotransferase n=1 Tax=Sinimarinibacterium flocculans TaxID=985250 RepID=UPI003C64A22E
MNTPYALSADAILVEASKRAGGATDFGEASFHSSLDRLVESLNREARLNAMGVVIATERLLQHAVNRLLYIRDRKDHPPIADEKIVKPVFIVGMPRTGTTILHDILAQDPRNRAPLTWELMFPSPPPERASYLSDPRIARCEAIFPAVDALIPGFKAMHPMGATLSQECVMMMADTMTSALFHNQFRVPAYQDYIDGDAPWGEVYRFHRHQLQHMQWKCAGERWVLKTGAHLWSLEHLLQEYPDARIVFTHRDPVQSMTSYASLTTLVRTMSSDEVDPFEVARDWTPRLCAAMNHAMDVRERSDFPGAKIHEMHFDRFARDQFAEVERIYEYFEIGLPADAADAMREFIRENPKGKHGEHRYRESDYGIEPAAVRKAYARYIGRFGLEAEPADEDAAAPDGAPPAARMRAWRVHAYGQPLDVLKLEDVPVPSPAPGQLQVRAQGIPLNLNDLERITGGNMMLRPKFPYAPGMEVMGTVEAAGQGAEHWVGKRVAAITDGAYGGYAEFCNCPPGSAFEIPDDVPMPDAAALFFPFHLAWLGLHDRARLRAGETVLIHAAAGGSGSAAVQLARHAGATVIAAAGSEEKTRLCSELGADHVINYRDADLSQTVLELTQGRGVDVVFDNVGEAVFEPSLRALAYNGRYLMMGFASNKAVTDEPFVVPRRLALGNAGVFGVMLAYLEPALAASLKTTMGGNFPARALGEQIHASILRLYREGAIKAVVGAQIAFDDIPEGIAALSQRQTVGRVIATVA